MKKISCVGFMVLLATATSSAGASSADTAIKGAITGVFMVLVVFAGWAALKLLSFIFGAAKKGASNVASTGRKLAQELGSSDEAKVMRIDDRWFKKAHEEVVAEKQDEGLWIKCLSLAEGDPEKRKALYIKLRARQLSEGVVS